MSLHLQELSRRRKLTDKSVELLALPGSSALLLPECSNIGEAVLSKAIINAATSPEIDEGL